MALPSGVDLGVRDGTILGGVSPSGGGGFMVVSLRTGGGGAGSWAPPPLVTGSLGKVQWWPGVCFCPIQ